MMKLPGLRRAEPAVEVNDGDLVQWRLDIAQPLPRITREELLSRLWIDQDTLRGRSAISMGLEAEAMATA
jgi:hypothetical protein